jgi:hypothetical protein
MHRSFIIAVTLIVAPLVPLLRGDEGENAQNDIPIRRVVMFSSGVAFFEHRGEVEGTTAVDLKFNVRNMNDLLKSMVLQDLGGGNVSTVSYASKEPVTRALKTFAIDLTSNPSIADVLKQIRGERIEIDAPTKATGIIVGVERREVPAGKEQVVEVSYLNLLTDDGLRSISLENVGRIRLANPTLDSELRQALEVLAGAKSIDKKSVSLNFTGEGRRPVRVGYIQEAPIWKTSYRLVLSDDEKPFLQGWAIVENTTEADWNNVNLTLVSGRPISFIMDLYEPLYVDRPEVMPELFASLRPRTYDQDLAAADDDFAEAGKQAGAREKERLADGRGVGFGMGGMGGMGSGIPGAPGASRSGAQRDRNGVDDLKADQALRLQQGVQSVATAADVGEMFRYEISMPVTLERSKSAMLPIVNESVEGEKLAIYNESTHAKHPLNGLRFKNTTDLHLMQGPITVFDEGAYAGDAQIQDLQPKTERLISYAMALDTEVAVADRKDASQLVNVRIEKGNAIISHKFERSRTYTVKNSGKKEKLVLIEYPIEQKWELVEPKEADEKTRNLYRFEVSAKPGVPASLPVKEAYTASQTVVLTNLPDDTIALFLRAKEVSEEVRDALREVARRKTEIQQVANQRQEFERQIQVIDQEQRRIRENMAQLSKDSELFRRYEAKFTKQEDDIETLRERVSASVEQEQKLRSELDAYLSDLTLG